MRDVFVVGTGATRVGKQVGTSLRELTQRAVSLALADASALPGQVQAVYYANAAAGLITGQEMIRGESALRGSGLLGRPVFNIENACASGSTAFHLAWLAIASGHIDVALVVGAEKLTHEDKARSFAALRGAADQEALDEIQDGASKSLFMDVYARGARAYLEHSDATEDDLARVAVKAQGLGALNPIAHYGRPTSIDEVLGSRTISAPLRLLMCAPVSDGAGALVLASTEGAARLGAEASVAVLATRLHTADGSRAWEDQSVVEVASALAYDDAGLGPQDIDIVELHDAAASAELMIAEELGLCEPNGGGARLVRSGDSLPGGRIPINPSGGLIARGHPIGATGCLQLIELSDQLRGRAGARQVEGARIGLAENAGGWVGSDFGDPAVSVVTILGARQPVGGAG